MTIAALTAATASARKWPVISALGVVEILAWGSSFYLPAVLAAPIAGDTGWPLAWVVGGLSCGLLVAAAVSPLVGTTIGRHGGRPVLALAALLLAAGLATLGLAPVLPVYVAGWLVLGLGMGMGLYDPAYATLGRLYGAEARRAITTLTLWGGFASTVCWPLSAFLVEHAGWRWTCFAYAGLHLAVTLPLVLVMIPKPPARVASAEGEKGAAGPLSQGERRSFLLFAGMLVCSGLIMGMVSVHLLTLLQARGVALAAAVSYGALIGPSQVGARVIEMAGGGRHHPLWTLTASVALIAAGLALLASGFGWVAAALVLYGGGNGIFSIARGTVPLALFGPERYAPLIGKLARPALIAQAAAPPIGALVIEHAGTGSAFTVMVTLACLNTALLAILWANHPDRSA